MERDESGCRYPDSKLVVDLPLGDVHGEPNVVEVRGQVSGGRPRRYHTLTGVPSERLVAEPQHTMQLPDQSGADEVRHEVVPLVPAERFHQAGAGLTHRASIAT